MNIKIKDIQIKREIRNLLSYYYENNLIYHTKDQQFYNIVNKFQLNILEKFLSDK